jgi:diguanylate cyclase (GGDEF)-like protein
VILGLAAVALGGAAGLLAGVFGLRRAPGRRERAPGAVAGPQGEAAQTWLDLAAPLAQFGCWRVSFREKTMVWSAQMYRLYGVSPAEFAPTLEGMLEMFEAEARRAVSGQFAIALAEGGAFEIPARLRRGDGEWRDVVLRGQALGRGEVVGVMVDVTAQTQAQAQLRTAQALSLQASAVLNEISQEDALTGLSNRRQFDLALGQEFKRAVRSGLALGLVLVDLDHFRAYNASYGRAAGDACLRAVAEVIKTAPHRTGDVVARYGGGQIAVLLPLAGAAGAAQVAAVVREAVQDLGIAHAGAEGGRLSVSCGTAAFTSLADLSNPQELVRRADLALGRAKAEGRDRVCRFESSMNAELRALYPVAALPEMGRFIKSRA